MESSCIKESSFITPIFHFQNPLPDFTGYRQYHNPALSKSSILSSSVVVGGALEKAGAATATQRALAVVIVVLLSVVAWVFLLYKPKYASQRF
jgi:hypothetical protein